MKTGICPKCGAKDVRVQRGVFTPRNILPYSIWGVSRATLTNYLCASCGYVESYVDPECLADVERKLPEIGRADHTRKEPSLDEV